MATGGTLYDRMMARFPDRRYLEKYTYTLCIFYSFIIIGLCAAQTGLALLDLQLITHTDTEQASLFLTGASVGSMAGALTMGWMSCCSRQLKMTLALLGVAAAVAGLPWVSNYYLMIVMHACVAFFRAVFAAGGNADIIRTWEFERRIFLQILHFCFALGGLLAPVITQPFLAERLDSNTTGQATNSTSAQLSACVLIASDGINRSSGPDFPECSTLPSTRVQFAYAITAALFLVGFGMFATYNCTLSSRRQSVEEEQTLGSYEDLETPLPLSILLVTLALLFLVFFFLVAVETGFISFLLTFVVDQLSWTKAEGTALMSLFWACFAAFRFLIIFITNRISPFTLLVVSACAVVLSSIGTLISAEKNFDTGIWVCVAFGGFGMSTQFPSTLAWAEESIVRLSPKIVSSIVFFCTLPGIINPVIIGSLMSRVSPLWLFYVLSIESGVCLALIIALQIWARLVLRPVMKTQTMDD